MIILVIDIDDIRTFEGERNAPVSTYAHCPDSFSIGLEGVELQPRQAHVPGLSRDVQSTQDQAEPSGMLGLDAGGRPTDEETCQALVREAQDGHGRIVTRNVSGYNRRRVAEAFPRHEAILMPLPGPSPSGFQMTR